MWGRRLARGRENARLARAVEAADEIRDEQEVAWAIVGGRDGQLTIVRVFHTAGARTVQALIEPRGEVERVERGLRWPGLAAVILRAMGFRGRRRSRMAYNASGVKPVHHERQGRSTDLQRLPIAGEVFRWEARTCRILEGRRWPNG